MKNKTNVNLQIGFGLSVVLLILSSAVSYICIMKLLDSNNMVRHTNEVIRTLEQVVSSIKEAESSQRGYLLTGEDKYLEPFDAASVNAQESMAKVLQLTTDNPRQQKTGQELLEQVKSRIERMQVLIKQQKAVDSIDKTDVDIGRAYMEMVRKMADQMISEENGLLVTRTVTMEKFTGYTPVVIVLAALLAVLISVVFYIRIVSDMAERSALQKALEQKDIETSQRISVIQDIAAQISEGNYSIRINDKEKDTLGTLAGSLNRMAGSLATSFESLANNEWVQTGIAILNEKMMGEKQVSVLSTEIINFLAAYTDSKMGALYLVNNQIIELQSGYALQPGIEKKIPFGQGIAGQCILSKKEIILDDIKSEAILINHGTGVIKPAGIIAFPVFHEDSAIGVVELAAIIPYNENALLFFRMAAQSIGTAIYGAQNHRRLQELLEETQSQSEELQVQHSELENLNAELEAHTQRLQASEEELRVQQEELQQSNVELEERNRMIRERNAEIMKKAEELEQSTRYKSEFMANMSHELRTPLNSILLLSRYLAENGEKNLSDDQKESASVIFNSGNSLLNLIDELLDLSKIEAGKMDLDYTQVYIPDVLSGMQSLFAPVANERHIDLLIHNELNSVSFIESDKMKLEQILKNLLSNALKFTAEGYVMLRVRELPNDPLWLEFSVEDTGVGIPEDKLGLVFEAFTQADGSTKRKYGGTGLGLSISRQLARLLGGEIAVKSEPGKGSVFSLKIPIAKQEIIVQGNTVEEQEAKVPIPVSRHVVATIPADVPDDRNDLSPDDKVILIVEDDTPFAKALLQFTRSQKYKGIVIVRGDQAIEMALKYKPLAILLDIQLPVKDGWEVMDELKSNGQTRHIPVHIMSSLEVKKESRKQGAVDFIGKPLAIEQMQEMFKKLENALTKNPKKVLIVEENAKHAQALAYFLESFNVSSSVKHSLGESVDSLRDNDVDCVILDMGIPDKNAYDILEMVKQNPGLEDVPIIVFTGKNLSQAEANRIKQYADSIVVKTAHSYQRILDEVALFLHLVETQEEDGKRPRKHLGAMQDILGGKTILIADDDVRNIFSLTKALEKHRMKVISATDGAEALQKLEEYPETDMVLMDMMMPQMDGYESTMKIRKHQRFKNLPVIAVTAKAMLGDREKCIAAGASDYISKPVDMDQLISLLRVWLYDKQSF